MRAFRFSLQRVLDVKQLLENQQRQALASARANTASVVARLEAAASARSAALEEDGAMDRIATKRIDPLLRELGWRRREQLLHRVRQLNAELQQTRQAEEAERERLVVRHRERRVLERLAEKQRQEYILIQSRREQSMLDEAAARGRAWRLKENMRQEQFVLDEAATPRRAWLWAGDVRE